MYIDPYQIETDPDHQIRIAGEAEGGGVYLPTFTGFPANGLKDRNRLFYLFNQKEGH